LTKITVIKGDITKLEVDCIVNAANQSLLGGAGLDGAVHAAAGPDLVRECRSLGGCQTGMAKVTSGYKLPAKYIIHTVGPIWRGGRKNEEAMLYACYWNSLTLAADLGFKSIAISAISTGAFCYPVRDAAAVAAKAVKQFIVSERSDALSELILVCNTDGHMRMYAAALNL